MKTVTTHTDPMGDPTGTTVNMNGTVSETVEIMNTIADTTALGTTGTQTGAVSLETMNVHSAPTGTTMAETVNVVAHR